jgi:hypothetical protein
MQLALSSAALPDASIATLRRAAQRRDLNALELVLGAGHAHGIGTPSKSPPSVDRRAIPTRGESPPVQWLLASKRPTITDLLYWARQASLLDAGLLLRNTITETPLGLPLALDHGTDLEEAQQAAAWARMHDAKTCWTVELGRRDEEQFTDVLDATAPTLAHVRLIGAGPETQSAAPGTAGTGAVLKELALNGYSGTVALTPSADGSTAEWQEWLLEGRGWGCGTAAQKKAARTGSAS